MKQLLKGGIAFLLLSLVTSLSFGQSEDANYLKFDYVKVKPDAVHEYMEYMRTTWMPLYQKQVKAGTINSWSLYRVFTPGGMRGDYNFVTITAASSLNPYESMRPRELLELEGSSRQMVNQLMQKANSMRTVMFTELWKAINKMAQDETTPNSARYLMIDYMDVVPGKEYDYQMLEDELIKPLHQERKELDRMQGWEVFSLLSPGGSNYGYNFATGNYFNTLENTEFGITDDVIQSEMPGTNVPELFNTIFTTRTLVSSQIWELVGRTE